MGAAATAQQLLRAIKAALAARKPSPAVVEGAAVEAGVPVALGGRHDWLDDAAEAAGGLVDEAGEAVGGVVEEAREATEGAVDWMVEQAEEAVGAAEEFVQGVGETVSEGVGAAADWAAEQAGAAGEWVSEQAEAAGAAVSEAAGEVWQAAQELGEEVVRELGQTWQDLKQAIDDLTSGRMGADLINRLKRILDDVTGGGDDEGDSDDELDGGVVGPLPGAAVEECGRGDTTLVRDDKVDLSLASHHTVTAGYSGEITGAGKEVATFALGRSEWKRHDDGSIGVFGVIQMDNAWGVNSHGLIDVASAESPAVTKDTWVRVCEDLTPNSGGWPARTTYWSKDLSSRHEMFHANDDDFAARAAVRTVAADLQGKFFRPAKDMGPQATQLLTTAVEKVSLAVQDHYKDGGEARAYAVGKFDYQSLVDAIKARAAREGWVGSPKEPAPLPASGTPLVPD